MRRPRQTAIRLWASAREGLVIVLFVIALVLVGALFAAGR
jgi:hypothetical protein